MALINGVCVSMVEAVSGMNVEFYLEMIPQSRVYGQVFELVSEQVLQYAVGLMRNISVDTYSNVTLYENSGIVNEWYDDWYELNYYVIHFKIYAPSELKMEMRLLEDVIDFHNQVVMVGPGDSNGFLVKNVNLFPIHGTDKMTIQYKNDVKDILDVYGRHLGTKASPPANLYTYTMFVSRTSHPFLTLQQDELTFEERDRYVYVSNLNATVSHWDFLYGYTDFFPPVLRVDVYDSIIQEFLANGNSATMMDLLEQGSTTSTVVLGTTTAAAPQSQCSRATALGPAWSRFLLTGLVHYILVQKHDN